MEDPEPDIEDAVVVVRPRVVEPIAESIPIPFNNIVNRPIDKHVKFIESNEIVEIPNRYGNSPIEIPVDYHDEPFRFPPPDPVDVPIEIPI